MISGSGRPGEIRVDDDDPGAGLKRPGGMLARAQPVEVVEHLERRRIPVGPVRRLRRTGRRAAAAPPRTGRARRAAAARGARQAEIDERVAVLLSRGGPWPPRYGRQSRSAAPARERRCPAAAPTVSETTTDVRFTRSSLLSFGSSSRLPASGCSRRRAPCAESGAFSDPLRFSAAAATPRDRPSGSYSYRESPRLP